MISKISAWNNNLVINYGLMSFWIIILHNVFLLFHIEIFVNIYKIDKTSFWFAEIVFLIWNSCNDPLFGWISDKRYLSSSKSTQHDVIKDRLNVLFYAGPLFSLSFVLFWFSWISPSFQLIFCLCLYDTFLTQLDLQHSSLLADLTVSLELRTQLNRYCSIFGAFASLSAFFSYFIWNSNGSLIIFRSMCIFLTCISIIGFFVCNYNLKNCTKDIKYITVKSNFENEERKISITKFLYDIFDQKNFILFSAMNLIQVFHCHFNSNFYPLFLSILLGDTSTLTCSLLLGLSFLIPHINNVYLSSLCKSYGSYMVIKMLFIFKFCTSLSMIYIGCGNLWIMSLFIASNRIFTEGTCKLLNLVISDLIDEDAVIHSRPQAVSALIFGITALLSKPGQTFAPIVGTLLLSYYTGKDVFSEQNRIMSANDDLLPLLTIEDREIMKLGCFRLLVLVPTICALFQILVWQKFTLHSKKLMEIKSLRTGFKITNI